MATTVPSARKDTVPVGVARPAGSTATVACNATGSPATDDGTGWSIEVVVARRSTSRSSVVDEGPNALVAGSAASTTPGRYVFQVRNDGTPGTAGAVAGQVADQYGRVLADATATLLRSDSQDGTAVAGSRHLVDHQAEFESVLLRGQHLDGRVGVGQRGGLGRRDDEHLVGQGHRMQHHVRDARAGIEDDDVEARTHLLDDRLQLVAHVRREPRILDQPGAGQYLVERLHRTHPSLHPGCLLARQQRARRPNLQAGLLAEPQQRTGQILRGNVIDAQRTVRRAGRVGRAGMHDRSQTEQRQQTGTGQQAGQWPWLESVRHESFPIQPPQGRGKRKCERLSFDSLAVMTNGAEKISDLSEEIFPKGAQRITWR